MGRFHNSYTSTALILLSIFILFGEIHSFNLLGWFESGNKRGGRQEIESNTEIPIPPNAEYGECEYFTDDGSVPPYPPPTFINQDQDQGFVPDLSGTGQYEGLSGNPYGIPMTGRRPIDLRGARQTQMGMRVSHSQYVRQMEALSNSDDYVAQHRTLPIDSFVTVTNAKDGRSVVVRIIANGGPVTDSRVLALSQTAFHQIEDLDQGVFPCFLTVK